MRAAVLQESKDIVVKEVPDPEMGKHDVLIRPKYCGISSNDLGFYQYRNGSEIILGHEFSGKIVDIGQKVMGWEIGDRVVPNSVIPCNLCSLCKQGRHNLCNNKKMPGITINGGFADLVILPQTALYRIPEEVSYEEAAVVEPLTTVLHGYKRIREPILGSNVIVQGAGAVGLYSVQVGKLQGANLVGVIEKNKIRRNLADLLGADFVIDPSQEDVQERLEYFTNSKGIDIVVECTGAPEAISESFTSLNKGGNFLVLGFYELPVEVDFLTAVKYELKLLFAYCGYTEFETALQLIAKKRVQVKPMISHIIKLEDIVDKGFEAILHPNSITVKVLVELEK
ncbi:MAG: alcohol dehydrogenase catalytic domain-containing protein [Candidatus Heimdallarchaeota archaeon]|nr:MAG: alcohol dehydrogenase catalytic domain-containing protein [Candidatus Heimdallarchaeota archaeon]